MTLAIFGGTFDPIHIGHLAIAEDARHALQAERVIFVPAAQQPFKTRTRSTPAADRLAMVRLGIANNPGFSVADLEIQRGGISYTVETIERLHHDHSQHELYLIVGADAALALPRWHAIERLFELCRVAIVARPGYRFDRAALDDQLPAARSRIVTLSGPALEISGTELRQRIRAGRPVRYHLPSAVRAYIAEHRLYQDADS